MAGRPGLPDRRLSIAPMLDYTDRHARFFFRLLSARTWLYTEMITTGALLHGDTDSFLKYSDCEHPLALQLGGSDARDMARCARLGEKWGYDEININIGCPSDRVKSGQFGACLMAFPGKVADCLGAMQDAVDIPVSIKTRIGVDQQDSYEQFAEFIGVQVEAGCRLFIIHARKAWLKGLSPKQNRQIPPLHYDYVYRIVREQQDCRFIVNGGITTVDQVAKHLRFVDGIMIGKAAMNDPFLLAKLAWQYEAKPLPERRRVLDQYLEYVEQQVALGISRRILLRPIIGLFHGLPGARLWRRHLGDSIDHRMTIVQQVGVALEACRQLPGFIH